MNKRIKKQIEECILNGIQISYPLKTNISDWYETITISKIPNNKYYAYYNHFTNLEDALNYFCEKAFTSYNYHNMVSKMREDGVQFSDDDCINKNNIVIDM
jgi:hypothetical protein